MAAAASSSSSPFATCVSRLLAYTLDTLSLKLHACLPAGAFAYFNLHLIHTCLITYLWLLFTRHPTSTDIPLHCLSPGQTNSGQPGERLICISGCLPPKTKRHSFASLLTIQPRFAVLVSATQRSACSYRRKGFHSIGVAVVVVVINIIIAASRPSSRPSHLLAPAGRTTHTFPSLSRSILHREDQLELSPPTPSFRPFECPLSPRSPGP